MIRVKNKITDFSFRRDDSVKILRANGTVERGLFVGYSNKFQCVVYPFGAIRPITTSIANVKHSNGL